jgi:hypothetical protein
MAERGRLPLVVYIPVRRQAEFLSHRIIMKTKDRLLTVLAVALLGGYSIYSIYSSVRIRQLEDSPEMNAFLRRHEG